MEHVVNIVLESMGNDTDITVIPTTLHVRHGETIRWQAFGVEAFMVVFRDGAVRDGDGNPEVRSKPEGPPTPQEGRVIHPLLARDSRFQQERRPVATGIASHALGAHPYVLALWEPGTDGSPGKLHMDTGCPEVIIR